jgi:hypothetical protein
MEHHEFGEQLLKLSFKVDNRAPSILWGNSVLMLHVHGPAIASRGIIS